MRYTLILMLFASIAAAQVADRRTQHIFYVSQQDSAIGDMRNARVWNMVGKGAFGDGAHDMADSAAFAHGLIATRDSGIAAILFPPGDFYVGNVFINWSNVKIVAERPRDYSMTGGWSAGGTRIRGSWGIAGPGFQARNIAFSNNGELMILYDAGDGFLFDNCIFVNAHSASPFHNFLANDASGKISNSRSYKGYHGFAIRASDVQLSNCSAYSNFADGLVIKADDGQKIHDVLVTNFSASSADVDSMNYGINVQVGVDTTSRLSKVVITGFSVRGAIVGVEVSDLGKGYRVNDVHISSGTIDSTRFWGFHAKYAQNLSVVGVSGKRVITQSPGFNTFLADTCRNVSIMSPNADSNAAAEHYYTRGGTGISLVDAKESNGSISFYSNFDYAQVNGTVYSSQTFLQNLSIGGYIGLSGNLYHSGAFGILNKAGNGFDIWAYRDTSASYSRVILVKLLDPNIEGHLTMNDSLWLFGTTGNPQTNQPAPIGSLFSDFSGGGFYYKASGAHTNTGWMNFHPWHQDSINARTAYFTGPVHASNDITSGATAGHLAWFVTGDSLGDGPAYDASGNTVIAGYLNVAGNLYHNNALSALNKAGNGFVNWAVRNTSGSEVAMDLNPVGTVTAVQYRLSALNTAPSSASDTGTAGEVRIDANFIYICTAANTWKRTAISTW